MKRCQGGHAKGDGHENITFLLGLDVLCDPSCHEKRA